MSLEFPYEYAQIEGLGNLFYPIIRIKVKTTFGWYEFDFLVDTGADITTVPSHFLPVLGLKKSSLATSYTSGVGGISVKTWDFLLTLKIGSKEMRVTASAVETKLDIEPLLLGRKDVFEERFNLFLDSKRKVTVISQNR